MWIIVCADGNVKFRVSLKWTIYGMRSRVKVKGCAPIGMMEYWVLGY